MDNHPLAIPTPSHLEWADSEIGVIIHLDMPVFEPTYRFRDQWGYTPSADIFNPTALDTDQWIETAKAAGAKYAVLVAKHCSGFSLWPTRAHDYSVASAPWRDGKGDIVADFFASCARHGLRPGLYASAATNAYLDVNNPGKVRSGDPEEQKRYNAVVMQQLRELWTDYGPLFEIWFDGGVLPTDQGGPDIVPMLGELQPDAVVFQGPPSCRSLLRWVGNERGEAPDPCWSATNDLTGEDGTDQRHARPGCADGAIWAPAESDMPNRDQNQAFMSGWFWREGDDQYLYSVDHLVERYYQSVGRNANLLLGMVIDNRGLVPDADVRQFESFGREIHRRFSRPLAAMRPDVHPQEIALPSPAAVDQTVLMEDTRSGHHIRRYEIDGRTPDGWKPIAQGTCVGHKKIDRFAPTEVDAVRVRITESVGEPVVRDFRVYKTT